MVSKYITVREAVGVNKLVAGGILNVELIFNELGLMVNFEMGEYCIMDHKRWMLGKIKYGI